MIFYEIDKDVDLNEWYGGKSSKEMEGIGFMFKEDVIKATRNTIAKGNFIECFDMSDFAILYELNETAWNDIKECVVLNMVKERKENGLKLYKNVKSDLYNFLLKYEDNKFDEETIQALKEGKPFFTDSYASYKFDNITSLLHKFMDTLTINEEMWIFHHFYEVCIMKHDTNKRILVRLDKDE